MQNAVQALAAGPVQDVLNQVHVVSQLLHALEVVAEQERQQQQDQEQEQG